MAKAPWLIIVGIGEDGPDGLSRASREALEKAEIIMGPPRHLALLGGIASLTARLIEWPVPFADGIVQLLQLRGQKVVMLTSGDPFWFGAGASVTRQLQADEWRAHPGVSTFSQATACLGWSLQDVTCLGLHATPLTRLRPHLSQGARAIVLLRDGAAVLEMAKWLDGLGFGASTLHVMEALGGPRAQLRSFIANGTAPNDIAHPVCVGLDVSGNGMAIGLVSGRADALFENDGQITKRPMRALTLSALAPRPGEHLWDIGGGSGSIAIEWLLCHASLQATTFERNSERADRIRGNALELGVERLNIVTGEAPLILQGHEAPDVVFIGGGLNPQLLGWLRDNLAGGTRIVANAVTLESAALLTMSHADLGGELMRVELATTKPVGVKTVWKASFPLVQWSVTL